MASKQQEVIDKMEEVLTEAAGPVARHVVATQVSFFIATKYQSKVKKEVLNDDIIKEMTFEDMVILINQCAESAVFNKASREAARKYLRRFASKVMEE